MPDKYFNKGPSRRIWLGGIFAVFIALVFLGYTGSVFAASNYGDCTYGSANYGGDCSTPPAVVAPSGGGGLIVGSGPLAPGYQVGSNATSSAVTIPSAVTTISSSSLNGSQAVLEATTTTLASAGAISLQQNRQLNDKGEDIRTLQKFLNSNGFVVAQSGPGSIGNETSVFGIHTYRALVQFQSAHGLPATGFLGPMTRGLINGQ